MKKLSVVLLAMVFCFWLVAIPLLADPGDGADTTPESTTATSSTSYPPPPVGWEGPWPPPDWDPMLDGSGPLPPPPTDGDGGDDGGWADPTD